MVQHAVPPQLRDATFVIAAPHTGFSMHAATLSLLLFTTLADGYQPDQPKTNAAIEVARFDINDSARQRVIPIKVYYPPVKEPAPLILFSHGLGGSRENNAYLGNHWASYGYVVIAVQHPGSDEQVWQSAAPLQRMAEMQKAASAANFQLRVKDIPAVINQLEKWNTDEKHPLFHRINLDKIGMSGHSFGAVTTQAVSGQTFPLNIRLTDPRIDAAVMMSPGVPQQGNAQRAFGSVKLPWLLMTGTNDTSVIGNQSAESRTEVYPALPAGEKYELVLDQAEHSAFSERALPGDRHSRNPNHHRAILAISTAFWDTYLKDDSQARAWLTSDHVRQVLEPKDRWQKK